MRLKLRLFIPILIVVLSLVSAAIAERGSRRPAEDALLAGAVDSEPVSVGRDQGHPRRVAGFGAAWRDTTKTASMVPALAAEIPTIEQWRCFGGSHVHHLEVAG